MDVVRAVRESRTYAVAATLRRWACGSAVVSFLGRERVIRGLVAVTVILSTVRVVLADLNAAVKFLSFAALFLLTVVVASPFTEPPSE